MALLLSLPPLHQICSFTGVKQSDFLTGDFYSEWAIKNEQYFKQLVKMLSVKEQNITWIWYICFNKPSQFLLWLISVLQRMLYVFKVNLGQVNCKCLSRAMTSDIQEHTGWLIKENIPSSSTLEAMNMQKHLKFQNKYSTGSITSYVWPSFCKHSKRLLNITTMKGSLGSQKWSITKSFQDWGYTVLQNTLPSNFMIRGDCATSLVDSTIRNASSYFKQFLMWLAFSPLFNECWAYISYYCLLSFPSCNFVTLIWTGALACEGY